MSLLRRLAVLTAAPAILAATTAFAQQQQADPLARPLPTDPKVTVGTLPNGIRYYIRQNTMPEKRAELRLVVNAGSILEDADQQGLAHFVEHTAFNGTRNFKKNELVSYLQSIGVRFGPDLNAYTSFDETVYILPVPTDSAHIVEKAFQILEDWAHGQLFDSTEVVAERGVVVEEWRGRRGAGDRMLQQWLPVAFKDSRYAERLPIGKVEILESATPDLLRRFYRDWYRPDLMAVVAVGDFDKARIENLIKQHFSGIAMPASPRPRTLYDVPDNAQPLIAVATDREAASTSINVIYKRERDDLTTIGDYRRALMERLYFGMLNARFQEIAQKPDAPFLGAGASKGSFFARTREGFFLGAGVADDGVERGLEALVIEARRVDQFGFLASELDRQKQAILRSFQRAYDERDKTNSGVFVQEYVSHYLTGEAFPGIEFEYQVAQALMPTIALQEVNAMAKEWITDENRVVIVQAPQRDGLRAPTQAQLLAVLDRAALAPIQPYTETLAEEPLIPRMPARGRIASERKIPGVDVTEWRLSNGARVLVKATDFKDDEVLFGAYSMGGTSLAPDSLYMSAAMASQVVALGGLGSFNQIDLQKTLTGKAATVTPIIDDVSERLSGRASPKDVETLFQLIHLRFTAPRLDSSAFMAFRNQVGPFLANRGMVPEQVFSDTVSVTMAQGHFRARPLTPATFAEVDPARSFAFYRDRFADAGDFTFLFVGAVNVDSLKPYVEQYLASLPATGRRETFRNLGIEPPRGVVEKTVRRGVEPKANTLIAFTGPFQFTPENRFALRALTDLLDIKLTETLREQLGGTYGVGVGGSGSKFPAERFRLQIQYGSSPENVQTLFQSVLAVIDTLKTQGPAQADVEKVREQMVRAREVDMRQNNYWLVNLQARDQHGEDLNSLMAPWDAMVRGLTAAQIQQAARRYLDTSNYARFVLLPEN